LRRENEESTEEKTHFKLLNLAPYPSPGFKPDTLPKAQVLNLTLSPKAQALNLAPYPKLKF